MSNLNAPKDLSLHPIWNHAIAWARFTGKDPYLQEDVLPIYERFLAMPSPPHPYETPYQFPAEGYVLRKATLADVPQVANAIVAAGNFSQDIADRILTEAVTEPFSWSFVWEYKGEMLQYEGTRLGLDGKCYLGHTVHLDHTRPHWVWRESQRPVWDALAAAGYHTIISALRKDRETWMPHVIEMYNAKLLRELPKAFILEFKTDAPVFQGWPERTTLGPDWEYRDGSVAVRETNDLDWVRTQLDVIWAAKPARLPLVKEMLDRWYNLDKATILVISDGDVVKNIRMVRRRRGTVASDSILTPINEYSAEYMFPWLRATGYTTVTSFVLERDVTAFGATLAKSGFRHGKTHQFPKGKFVEIIKDL